MAPVARFKRQRREKLPIVVVVLDVQEIGLIRVKQEIKGIPRYGVGIGGIDWGKLAEGLGAEGTVVDTEAGLQSALQTAATSGKTRGRVEPVRSRRNPDRNVLHRLPEATLEISAGGREQLHQHLAPQHRSRDPLARQGGRQ